MSFRRGYKGGEEETLDDLLQGRLQIHQKVSGFRYSVDALLLAHFAGEAAVDREPRSVKAIDLGSGTGVIPLVLSLHQSFVHITGLELVAPLVEMSRRSIALNRLEERISIIEGDIRHLQDQVEPRAFDLVISNPPYRRAGEGRINPDRDKAIARHELAVNLDDILKATSFLLKRRGLACFIYGAFRLTDLIAGLRKEGLEPARMRFIHSRNDEQAKMVLVEAQNGGPAESIIEPPLIVYRDQKNYTDEVLKIFQGPENCRQT